MILSFLEVYFVVIAAALIAYLITTGCSMPQPVKYDEDKTYARRARLEVNKLKGVGSIVVPRAAKYEVTAESDVDMDFLLVTTCSREHEVMGAGDSFRYTYIPAPGVEDNRPCPLRFSAVEKKRDRRTVGVVEFQDPAYALPAKLCCNGACGPVLGVSVCDSAAGLVQRMEFSAPIEMNTPDPACKLYAVYLKGAHAIEFKTPRGECNHVIREASAPGRIHRLTTYGYDEVEPKEDG